MKKIFFIFSLFVLFFSAHSQESPYGMCAHLNRIPLREAELELDGMKKTGIGYVRTDLDWRQVEPLPGKWDFSVWDAVVAAAGVRGIKILPILGGEFPAHGKPPYRNLERWLAYVEQCVTRYRGKIDCYEVLNEADCPRPWGEEPNAVHYAAFLKATYLKIKSVDPSAKVLFTGVSDFGEPMKFVEAVFASGGNCFDAMNFHPYQWRNSPESQLPLRLHDLKKLMKKYGLEKPIWITEIGNSSAPDRFLLARAAVPAALRSLGFSPDRTVIGFLADTPSCYYTGGLDDYLPEWGLRRPVSFAELRTISVELCPVVALPGQEGFPASEFSSVEAYVRRGGTLILPGGLPFYFDFQKSEKPGLFRTKQINAELVPRLHLSWEAFWVNPRIPRHVSGFEAGETFPELKDKLPRRPSMRFLSGTNLKGKDRMEPIVYGIGGGFKLPVAAIYRLDSDLKGCIIISVDDSGTDSVTEIEQAQRLPREYLLSLSNGAEKVFNYRFRAGEWNRGREAHFGIVRRGFESKPAQTACRTLIRHAPPGSSGFRHTYSMGTHCVRWVRPDGKAGTALWTSWGKTVYSLANSFSGHIEDIDGVRVSPEKGTILLSPSVLYLTE